MNKPKEMGFVKSIFSYSIASWINIIIGLAYTILSTRILIPETYGMVSIFQNAGNTLMYVICLGVDASFIRFFNERPNNDKSNDFSFKLIFVISLMFLCNFLIVTVFLYDWFNQYMFGQVSWFLTIMLYCSVFSNLLLRFFNIIYRMTFNVRQYTIQNVLIQSSVKCLVIIGALIEPTYKVVISFQVIGIAVVTIVYAFMQRKDIFPSSASVIGHFRQNYRGYKPVFKYAVFAAPTYISTNLNVLLVQQTIRESLGAFDLGIYSSVHIFSTLYGAIQTGFTNFWSAYVYKNYEKEHDKISRMTDYVMLVAIISLSLFVLFRKVLYLFIGEQYQSGISFFALVLMVDIFALISQGTIYGIDIVKKNYITAILNCVYIFFNIGFVYLGAKLYGLIGVAFGLMIARLLLLIINTAIAQKYYKTISNTFRFIYGILCLIAIASLPSIQMSYFVSSIIIFGIVLSTCAVFYRQYKESTEVIGQKIRTVLKKDEK